MPISRNAHNNKNGSGNINSQFVYIVVIIILNVIADFPSAYAIVSAKRVLAHLVLTITHKEELLLSEFKHQGSETDTERE